ncbi:hypothetical protein D9758_003376 [Tetrapyrgos nigripes]|uniref:Zn(2)-C6 fungal-type domain-containing protein n=1 Tax=Tetrapyrgos nigripes TaxID=182062 RepID=A0A8H5LW11_9AGAR|nr:hypothetical protein D9758_003376 [Tetrapyrgos nigripes]
MTEDKKRRTRQACDTCRRRKVRCNTSDDIPDNTCVECYQSKTECTYEMSRKKRGPRFGHAFLRTKLAASAQAIVSQILSTSSSFVPPEDPDKIREVLVKLASYIRNLELELGRRNAESESSPAQGSDEPAPTRKRNEPIPKPVPKLDDINEIASLSNVFKCLSVVSNVPNTFERHFGKSSNVMLIKFALDMRQKITGETDLPNLIFQGFKRAAYWDILPWQIDLDFDREPYMFPEDDLLQELIEIYFEKINIYMPLLHRPTFTTAIKEGLHLVDEQFGGLVLGLCALASRQSDDPRNGYEGVESRLSYGWKWFRQINLVRRSFVGKPSLYELQLYCLTALFLKSSSVPHGAWILTGIGVRYAQEMGAHRHHAQGHKPTVETELWKRAFWVLMATDGLIALLFGRPRAMQLEDFDLEYPLEVDDEYWEDPKRPFVQPPEIPSTISGWVHYLKLMEIMGLVQRGIYSVRRLPWNDYGIPADDPEYDQKTVVLLDSALNQWIDSTPEHVKWDKHRKNDSFFNQSVMLHAMYYWAQIQLHKTYIPGPEQENNSILASFPSLAICVNAARSCVHILESQYERQFVPIPLLLPIFMNASTILLLNIWRGTRTGAAMDRRKELADVYRSMRIVKCYENNYELAGRLYDTLHRLILLTRLPMPQETEAQGQKTGDGIGVNVVGDPSLPSLTPRPELQARVPDIVAAIAELHGPRALPDTLPLSNQQRTLSAFDFNINVNSNMNVGNPNVFGSNVDVLNTASEGLSTFPPMSPSPSVNLPFHSNELGVLPLYGTFLENQLPVDMDIDLDLDLSKFFPEQSFDFVTQLAGQAQTQIQTQMHTPVHPSASDWDGYAAHVNHNSSANDKDNVHSGEGFEDPVPVDEAIFMNVSTNGWF